MKLLDFISRPWAIVPAKLAEIRTVCLAQLRGEQTGLAEMLRHAPLDPASAETAPAAVSFLFAEDPQAAEPYQLIDGVAVIPIKGPLTKEAGLISWLFSGRSMRGIAAAFEAALADPAARAIVLDVDSPGGTVDGTAELAALIFASRGVKPILAHTDGMIASAAYWIASAADAIYISGDTVDVGSIGVVATHIDYSKADERYGEKWTEITAGRYKRIASSHRPLTEEGAGWLQGQVDYLYAVFVDAVARHRGIETEEALAMADGKIYIGRQAMEAGLVDGIEAFPDIIDLAVSAAQRITAKEDGMTLDELKSKHPELYQAVIAEGKAAADAEAENRGRQAGLADGRTEGAAAERQRIADVRGQLIPGHEALIEEMVADGHTSGPEAAVKVLAAEKEKRAQALKDYQADGQLKVPAADAEPPVAPAKDKAPKTKTEAGAELDRLAKQIQKEKGGSYGDAMNQALAANPALAKVYNGRED